MAFDISKIWILNDNGEIINPVTQEQIDLLIYGKDEIIRQDETDGTVTYFGFAPTGSAETDTAWKIIKSTDTIPKSLANGGAENLVWSNRLDYIYS
jgi:hypothetical protein